uniref:hypothetical protein n=1 Tax=Candidatus Ventrenecus sp. TaxID=3085654 RepID=UPI0040289F0A
MKELTIMMGSCGHKELKDYLMSLTGVSEVIVENEKELKIDMKYNLELITPKIIKMEIGLFLNILKIPFHVAFINIQKIKFLNIKWQEKIFTVNIALKGAIEDLFDIEGIEKVESNFDVETYDNNEEIEIKIKYDSSLISSNTKKEIELKLNL